MALLQQTVERAGCHLGSLRRIPGPGSKKLDMNLDSRDFGQNKEMKELVPIREPENPESRNVVAAEETNLVLLIGFVTEIK